MKKQIPNVHRQSVRCRTRGPKLLVFILLASCFSIVPIEAAEPEPTHEFSSNEISSYQTAAANGDIAEVRAWLAKGMNPNAVPPNHYGSSLSALGHAAFQGRESVVKELLQKGADVSAKCEGRTALHYAAINGYYAIVSDLKHAGAKLDTHDQYTGTTPLIDAATYGHTQTVRTLLDLGANIEVTDAHEQTALMLAAGRGHTEIVRLLLAKEESIHSPPRSLSTALQYAAGSGHDDTVRLLLSKHPEKSAINAALGDAARSGKVSTMDILLDSGADVNDHQGGEFPPLLLAAKNGHIYATRALLKRKADINLRFQEDPKTDGKGKGTTALQMAADSEDPAMLKFLLSAGADPSIANERGETALDQALIQNHKPTIELLLPYAKPDAQLIACARIGAHHPMEKLLQSGANPNARGAQNHTALGYAAARGDVVAIRMLLKHGATIDAVADSDGNTPLMCAAEEDQLAAVKLLVEAGAKLEAENSNGHTALFVVRAYKDTAAAEWLLTHGASLKHLDHDRETVLTGSGGRGYENKIRLLLDHGVPVDERDGNGRTALHCAVRYGPDSHVETIRLLLERGANPNVTDHEHNTPLKDARDINVTNVVEMLEKAGAKLPP